MNRKMRAKANNAAARSKKERKPCPKANEIVPMGDGVCEGCGGELTPVVAIVITEGEESRTLH
jgi:hypothetical protein